MRPYKNVERLIYAFSDLVNSGFDKHSLVLAGKATDEDMNSKRELAKQLSIENKVVFLQGLNYGDLQTLLGGSILFIFPSIEEGFGLPLLEAMTAGLPCIASNIEVFREVCDDAPLYFDPNNTDELKEIIKQVLLSEKLSLQLSRKSLKRAEIFSWENTAKQTLLVYKKILEE